ncbi:hypothetical protein Tco_1314068 [Tanacetum coccineum]
MRARMFLIQTNSEGKTSLKEAILIGYDKSNGMKVSTAIIWAMLLWGMQSTTRSRDKEIGIKKFLAKLGSHRLSRFLRFQRFDGGYVTFGGGAYGGSITWQRFTLKTDNLDLDDVYFCKG